MRTNVENTLESRKILFDAEKRNELNVIDRKASRELNFKKNPFEWKLIKLPNGKMKSVIVEENFNIKTRD
jgi:hypothetical protein